MVMKNLYDNYYETKKKYHKRKWKFPNLSRMISPLQLLGRLIIFIS